MTAAGKIARLDGHRLSREFGFVVHYYSFGKQQGMMDRNNLVGVSFFSTPATIPSSAHSSAKSMPPGSPE